MHLMKSKLSCMHIPTRFLRQLGVFGFDPIEPIILASLVSGDPLLLIGKAGTGKTFLLNSISEALGLEHRHYNASFISFDDLLGFPYPDKEGREVLFLKSPATVWDAESVLIDEISRCKPEIQNKFFSIIHEKKIQGIALHKLRYRWAAMNPLFSHDAEDQYDGSISLDQALADRFAFIIEVPDWNELSQEEQELVIHPAGEGLVNDRSEALMQFIEKLQPLFMEEMAHPDPEIVRYCRIITSLLTDAGYRMSPRRARQLARNCISVFLTVTELGLDWKHNAKTRSGIFKMCLQWSIPHRAWKGDIPPHIINTAHAECMRQLTIHNPDEIFLTEFAQSQTLSNKLSLLLKTGGNKDLKSLAVIQFMHSATPTDAAIFAFATQPMLEAMELLNQEAMSALTRKAVNIMHVDGKLTWRQRFHEAGNAHPLWSECVLYLDSLPAGQELRLERAKQLFLYLLVQNEFNGDPKYCETRMNELFEYVTEMMVKMN